MGNRRRVKRLRFARKQAFRGDRVKIQRTYNIRGPLALQSVGGISHTGLFMAPNSEKFELNHYSDSWQLQEYYKSYDYYKINWVRWSVTYYPQAPDAAQQTNEGTDQTPNQQIGPLELWVMADSDDNNAPELNDFTCRNGIGVKHWLMKAGKKYSFTTRPKVNFPVYKSVGNWGYAHKSGVWMDCTNYDIPHYAIKRLFAIYWYPPMDTQNTIVMPGVLAQDYTISVSFKKRLSTLMDSHASLTVKTENKDEEDVEWQGPLVGHTDADLVELEHPLEPNE